MASQIFSFSTTCTQQMPPKKASRIPTMRSLQTPPKKKRATPKNTRSKKNDDELGSSQGHLKIEDYEIIIDWLRDKKNYVACFGDGKAPAIGRRPKAMINGYELMAIHLRNVSPTKINLTPRQMKDRFKSYKDKYKKAHTKSMSTGFGLTPAYRKAGITTIEDKLENMCPLYAEMDEIFGNRPDVNPLFMADAEDEDNSSESSSEDNNSDSSNEMDENDSSHSSESTAIHPLLKNATSQVNIVALEQENTGDVSQLVSFVVSRLFTDFERYCPVKQRTEAPTGQVPMDEEAGVQAGATGVSCAVE